MPLATSSCPLPTAWCPGHRRLASTTTAIIAKTLSESLRKTSSSSASFNIDTCLYSQLVTINLRLVLQHCNPVTFCIHHGLQAALVEARRIDTTGSDNEGKQFGLVCRLHPMREIDMYAGKTKRGRTAANDVYSLNLIRS
jgi:hypothetical protein